MNSFCIEIRRHFSRVGQFLGSCLAFLSAASVADALSLTNLINQSEEVSPGGNWYWSDWFGYFKNLGSNFVQHNEHGVLYFFDTTGNGYIYFDRSTGFWFYMEKPTVPGEFLYVYRFGGNQWWKYEIGTSPNRKFINDSTSVTQYWYVHLESTADGPNGPLPLWWKRRGMLNLASPVSNNSPVNIAQLKHVVNETRKYMEDRLGISSALWDIAYSSYGGNPFPLSSGTPEDNMRPANLAQLKYLASGIYHVLNYTEGYNIAAHLSVFGAPSYEFPAFPWSSQTPVEENLVPLNIGQLKLVFSFSLDETPFAFVDLDEDGMNDAWELGIVAANSQYNSIYDVYPHVDDTGNGLSNLQESTIMSRVIFRGDTNRNGVVDADDEEGKAIWTKGPQGKGAIVLPNCDDDEGDGIPDNWIGGYWKLDSTYYPASNIVESDPDKDDIAPLHIAKLGLSSYPQGMSVTLSIAKPNQEHTFFANVPARDRIRIFKPTLADGGNRLIKAGDPAIIHPGVMAESYTFSGVELEELFAGEGILEFGVEGIEMGSIVMIKLRIEYNSHTIAEDEITMRVAPFILSDHTMPVRRTGNPTETVYVIDPGVYNQTQQDLMNLRDNLVEEYGQGGVLSVGEIDGYSDQWYQDGFEVGYAKAPYGQMAIVLDLPRATTSSNNLRKLTRRFLTDSNVGVYYSSQLSAETYFKNMGGDLESIPMPNAPGFLFHGSSFINDTYLDFFDAQDINTPIAVDTSWLWVGHVDEVISAMPDGRIVVANPELAWALLLWAYEIDSNAELFVDMYQYTLPCSNPRPPTYTLTHIIGCADYRNTLNFNSSDSIMHTDNLPQVRTVLGLDSPVTDPVAGSGNTGNASLFKAGALTAFIPEPAREFRVQFTSESNYTIQYRSSGGSWHNGGVGSIANDEVFPDAKCYVFHHWWDGTPQSGDVFTFDVDTTTHVLEMPVFYDDTPSGYLALTNNNVNSLIDGNTVLTASHHGPEVDYADEEVFAVLGEQQPMIPEPRSIMNDYVKAVFQQASIDNIIFVDERFYHNGQGSIHCGTNVERNIPAYSWWQQEALP